MKIIISACLAGYNCKYNGGNNYNSLLNEFLDLNNIETVCVCPEVMGGLPTPRTPSERVGNKVVFKTGEDVTEFFNKGANDTLNIAIENNCKFAILKAKSPSCGCGEIYDGTFSNTLREGNGVTCELLLKNKIKVFTENNYDDLLKNIK